MGEKTKFTPRKPDLEKEFVNQIENAAVQKGGIVFEPDKGNLHIDDSALTLPADITDMPSQDLGNALNAFTQQKIYLRTAIMRAEIEAEYAKRNFQKKSEALFSQMSDRRMSENAKERLLATNHTTVDLYEEWSNKKYILKYMENMLLNLEDIIFLLSREISRRGNDYTDENRVHNVQNMRR